MRSSNYSGRTAVADEDHADGRPGMLRTVGWSHRDAVAFIVALIASVVILINVLFLQAGPHPAPMIKSGVVAAITPAGAPAPTSVPMPRPPQTAQPQPKAEPAKAAPASVSSAPAASAAPAAPARANTAIISDIQRELTRRGFYDGTIDGKYGPRTDAAIRDFEQAAGLRPSTEPNEALLRAIKASSLRSQPTGTVRPQMAARPDPIGDLLAPSKQVVAVQRALSEFGYGQIRPTGMVDSETQAAIQKFERERKLPVTGQLSHRVVRELAAITGRPLE